MSAPTLNPAPMGVFDLADLAADVGGESDICAELVRELGRARKLLAGLRDQRGTNQEIAVAEAIVEGCRAALIEESAVLREAHRYGGAR